MIATHRRRWPAVALSAVLICAPILAAGQSQAGAREDQEAIAKLREQGIDLSSPQVLEFALYFPALEGAQRTWNGLDGQGFKGKIEPAGGGADYFLFAQRAVLVDLPTLQALRATLQSLAAENGGRYEGWGMR